MNCSICFKPCRSRTLCFVLADAGIERKKVCARCESSGVLIVAPPASSAARCKCGKAPTLCEPCAADRKHKPDALQKEIAKRIRALAKVTAEEATRFGDESHERGRAAGLEQAADLLEGAQRAIT